MLVKKHWLKICTDFQPNLTFVFSEPSNAAESFCWIYEFEFWNYFRQSFIYYNFIKRGRHYSKGREHGPHVENFFKVEKIKCSQHDLSFSLKSFSNYLNKCKEFYNSNYYVRVMTAYLNVKPIGIYTELK